MDPAGGLHAYWDAGIDHAVAREKAQDQPSGRQAVTERWSAEGAIAPSADDVKDLNPANWAAAGAQLADDKVYNGIAQNGAPDETYNAMQADLCKRQAVLGGFRLANLLNRTLGQ
jgi:hypothetical protein